MTRKCPFLLNTSMHNWSGLCIFPTFSHAKNLHISQKCCTFAPQIKNRTIMKTKHVLFTLFTFVLVSCEMPELNEASRQNLYGTWQLTKETMTNGDGFGGVVTREGDNLREKISYEFAIKDVSRTVIPNYSSEAASSFASNSYEYNLQQQKDGTWLLTIVGLFDKERNLEGGRSPITIHKLTKNSLEWEYEAYGGDEGPVGYYQYFKHTSTH